MASDPWGEIGRHTDVEGAAVAVRHHVDPTALPHLAREEEAGPLVKPEVTAGR